MRNLARVKKELRLFTRFFASYAKAHLGSVSSSLEKQKNSLVHFFLMKRGRYNRPFLHLAAMGVFAVGVLVAPFLTDTYPVFSQNQSLSAKIAASLAQEQSISIDTNVFATEISPKPRDKVITYKVERGDTISTIAKKFGVSEDTIKWANDLSSDELSVGDELKIPQVTGIVHKVASGDTIYSIAKKYNTDAQKIVDFTFNDFANPETFALVAGQSLMVPDGIKPSEQPFIKRSTFIAQGPIPVSPGGFTWPVHGEISQFATWYHMAIDITSSVGTPLVAAHNGTVTKVNIGTWDGGYGTSVYVDNGAGIESHYAHMSGVNVSVGQQVVGGRSVIGWVGLTGRTTGAHVHFEIRNNGALVNPMNYLQ